MKKHLLAILIIVLLVAQIAAKSKSEHQNNGLQTYIDTVYYNSEWKVQSSKLFADFYRVKVNSPKQSDRQFRDYYITGEMYARGAYVTIDNTNDQKSIFDGKYTRYYKNGVVAQEKNFKNGKLNGKYTEYRQDGLVDITVNFINGKKDGVYTEFRDNDFTIQIQYKDGKTDGTYYVSNQDGCLMRYDINTNQPIWESPKKSEKKKRYKDGAAWPYYNKNGVIVTMSNTQVKNYGNYYRIVLVITNNSLVPIEFDPVTDIDAISTHMWSGKRKYVRVLSSDYYMRRVKRSHNMTAAMAGLAAGMATYNAGYSSSTTRSNTYSAGSASAYGSRGRAYGSYAGASSTLTTTHSYDAMAAYQTRVMAQNKLSSISESMMTERKVIQKGYLKKTTINPSQAIMGYVNIDRASADGSLEISVKINGAEYVFDWDCK